MPACRRPNKLYAMKYFIRSVKYFFYFSFWTTVIVLVLVATGLASGNINEIFEGGWNAIWKIAIFFAIVAAVYPKLGFITRDMEIDRNLPDIREEVIRYMEGRGYALESESPETMSFRFRRITGRLMKMNEDRLVITRTGNTCTMEGLRKDVMRVSSGLSYHISQL